MNKFLLDFIKESKNQLPYYKYLFEWINQYPQQFRIINKIKVQQLKGKGIGLFAKISTEKCFTGLELIGCDRIKAFEINSYVSQIASKYYENNLSQLYYTTNILKILIQLFVHYQDSSMLLHNYSKFLQTRELQNPLFWQKHVLKDIYSAYLVSLIQSTHSHLQSIYNDLKEAKLFGIDYDFFIQLMSLIRSRNLNFLPQNPKHFDINSISIMSPLIDLANHSFSPNCQIEGKYYQHESESFVLLKSIKPIKENEEITINYGDYSNHDFLMKFGFVNDYNPYNEIQVNLDFNNHLEYTGQLFEFKQKLFRQIPDFSLDRFILYQHKINNELLSILRIYFLTENDIKINQQISNFTYKDFNKQISIENEQLICSFMIDSLKNLSKKYQEIKINSIQKNNILSNSNKNQIINLSNLNQLNEISDINYKNMLHICIEEELAIHNNLKFFQKHINK